MALSCSLLFTLDLVLWHRSIYYIGPGLATLLSGFQVFFLAGFGIFVLKEKATPKLIFSILLAVFGLYLIVGIDWHTLKPFEQAGVFLGLFTALCYAAYVLILRKIQSGQSNFSLSNLATLTQITLVNLCLMAIAAFFCGESFRIPDTQSWLALLGYGLVPQFLAWMFICAGIEDVPPAQIGLILILQPSLAFIWDILFFNRFTPPIEIIGVVLVIFGIYLGTRHDRHAHCKSPGG